MIVGIARAESRAIGSAREGAMTRLRSETFGDVSEWSNVPPC